MLTAASEQTETATAASRPAAIRIAMNGITGRMGYRQHLLRSILPLRDSGLVLEDGSKVAIEPILVGRSEAKVRSIPSPPKSVMSDVVCGSLHKEPKPAPPLKSMNTNCRSAGECATARLPARVRKSSDFPDPVVPPSKR